MRKTIWLTCLAAPAAVLAAAWVPRDGYSGPAAAPGAEPGASGQWVHGLGYVEPESEVRRLVFRASGAIACCRVAVSDVVRKGDLLMTLHNEEEKAAVAAAEREWRVALAERDKVLSGAHPSEVAAAARRLDVLREQSRFRQREKARQGRLALSQSVSDAEYQQARAEAAQSEAARAQAEAEWNHLRDFVREEDRRLAEAKVELAEARLQCRRRALEATELRAPCDGTVLEILKREGEGARPTDADPVAVLADLSHLRVRTEIDERYAHSLRVGQGAIVWGRGLGSRSFNGRVVLTKAVMGKKTVFARSASERKDLDVMEVLIALDGAFAAPVGLQVDVKVRAEGAAEHPGGGDCQGPTEGENLCPLRR
jgi:multidrug resistance efflux pump